MVVDSNISGRNSSNSICDTSDTSDTPEAYSSASPSELAILTPIQWYTARLKAEKRLNFPDFVISLGYWEEKTAEDAYMALLSFSQVSDRLQKAMSSQYETWKQNDGKEFWATRAIKSSLSMTAKRTAVGIISKSEGIINLNLTEDSTTGNFSIPTILPLTDGRPETRAVGENIDDNLAMTNYDADSGGERNDEENGDQVPTKKRKGSKQFDDDRRKSLQRRHSELGDKWTLKSGTVVENVLFKAGMKLKDFHPIHSFMLDLSDKYTRDLFSRSDWTEICSGLPDVPSYSAEASKYLEQFDSVETLGVLQELLDKRPRDIESRLVHDCLSDWQDLFEMNDPSPFDVVDKLSENWWLKSAWGVATKMAKNVPGCFIIPGELTGLDSAARRNNNRESSLITERKRIGVRADLIWRNLTTPETDWAIAEAAKIWCPHSNKYISESRFKLPRQLHDVLVGRSMEAGGAKELRDVLACGLLLGGPCIQRIGLCWGADGDNVTRIIKIEPARIYAKVRHLSSSIQAIHELLCFRMSTIHFITQYEEAFRRHTNKKKQNRSRNLTSSLLEPGSSRPKLLQRSP